MRRNEEPLDDDVSLSLVTMEKKLPIGDNSLHWHSKKLASMSDNLSFNIMMIT